MESRSYVVRFLLAYARLLGGDTIRTAAYVVFIDHPALVFLVPSFVAAAFLDDLVDGEVVQAGVLR